MRLIISILLITTSVAIVSAQKGSWEKGYYITSSKDTIYGCIKKGKYDSYLSFRYKKDSVSPVVTITPDSIRNFRWKNEEFRTLLISDEDSEAPKAYFAKIECKGHLTVYSLIYRKVTCSCNPQGEITRTRAIEKKGEGMLIIERSTFGTTIKNTKELSNLFSDRPELSLKIVNTKTKYSELLPMVEQYNEWEESVSSD